MDNWYLNGTSMYEGFNHGYLGEWTAGRNVKLVRGRRLVAVQNVRGVFLAPTVLHYLAVTALSYWQFVCTQDMAASGDQARPLLHLQNNLLIMFLFI